MIIKKQSLDKRIYSCNQASPFGEILIKMATISKCTYLHVAGIEKEIRLLGSAVSLLGTPRLAKRGQRPIKCMGF